MQRPGHRVIAGAGESLEHRIRRHGPGVPVAALVLVERIAHAAVVARAARAHDLQPLLHTAHDHQVRRHLVFDARPDLVAVHERQRWLRAPGPRAQEQAALVSAGIGRPLRVRVLAQVRAEVVAMHRLEVRGDLGRVDWHRNAADLRHPCAQDTVRQAARAVLVFRAFLLQQDARLGRVRACAHGGFHLQRAGRAQAAPLDLLVEVLAVEEVLVESAHAGGDALAVGRDVLPELLAHGDRGRQRAEVEAGAHAVGAPELDVVGVVVRLLDDALAPRVPGRHAVVEAHAHARPQGAQPTGVPADAPLAVDLHDPAELAVGGRLHLVHGDADGQRRAEGLVAGRVLGDVELGLAQSALQRGKQVGDGLRVVPDVRAGAVAAAGRVGAALPGPEAAVLLAQDRRRLQDGEIRGHRFHHLRRQGGVVEAVAEARRARAPVGIRAAPVADHVVDVREAARVPGTIRGGVRGRRLARAQRASAHVPREEQGERALAAGGERERNEEGAPW